MVEIYPVPSGYKPSPDYKIEIGGRPVFANGFAAGKRASYCRFSSYPCRSPRASSPSNTCPIATAAMFTL